MKKIFIFIMCLFMVNISGYSQHKKNTSKKVTHKKTSVKKSKSSNVIPKYDVCSFFAKEIIENSNSEYSGDTLVFNSKGEECKMIFAGVHDQMNNELIQNLVKSNCSLYKDVKLEENWIDLGEGYIGVYVTVCELYSMLIAYNDEERILVFKIFE